MTVRHTFPSYNTPTTDTPLHFAILANAQYSGQAQQLSLYLSIVAAVGS
jgi:hypothetical protein